MLLCHKETVRIEGQIVVPTQLYPFPHPPSRYLGGDLEASKLQRAFIRIQDFDGKPKLSLVVGVYFSFEFPCSHMGWGYINFEILSEKLCNLWGLRLNFIPVYGGPYYEFSFPICYQVSLFRLTLSSNPISCVTMRIKTFEISVKVNVYNIFIMVMV